MTEGLLGGHQDFVKIALVLALIAFGFFDLYIFKRKEIACGTWFFAVVIAAVSILSFEWLGFLRWVIAPVILTGGLGFIIMLSRLERKRNDDS